MGHPGKRNGPCLHSIRIGMRLFVAALNFLLLCFEGIAFLVVADRVAGTRHGATEAYGTAGFVFIEEATGAGESQKARSAQEPPLITRALSLISVLKP